MNSVQPIQDFMGMTDSMKLGGSSGTGC